MTAQLPDHPESIFGYVDWVAGISVGDFEDADRLPDLIPAVGVSVTFTPAAVSKKTETAPIMTILKTPISAIIGDDGHLRQKGQEEGPAGLYLPVGRYNVSYSGASGLPKGHPIDVTADHTIESPLDLTLASEYVPPPGSIVQVLQLPTTGAEVGQTFGWDGSSLGWFTPEPGPKGDKGDKGDEGPKGDRGENGGPFPIPAITSYSNVWWTGPPKNGTRSMEDGRIVYRPFAVGHPFRITAFRIDVTTAAVEVGALLHVGLYSTSSDGSPGNLLGTLLSSADTTTAGVKAGSSLAIDVQPGLYWFGLLSVGGTPTVAGSNTDYLVGLIHPHREGGQGRSGGVTGPWGLTTLPEVATLPDTWDGNSSPHWYGLQTEVIP